MAGLKPPSEGQVLLDGEPITGPGGKIGYMLQKDNLLEWRTIYKNILLGLEIRNRLTPEHIEYARGLLRALLGSGISGIGIPRNCPAVCGSGQL